MAEHHPINAVISRNLKAWMDGMPIAELAKTSHVGFGTVQRARNGNGNITVQNLDDIARAFGRRAADLLVDNGPAVVEPVMNENAPTSYSANPNPVLVEIEKLLAQLDENGLKVALAGMRAALNAVEAATAADPPKRVFRKARR